MAWLRMLATICLRFGQAKGVVELAKWCLRSARAAGQRLMSLRIASAQVR